MRKMKWILALALAALVVIVAFQNREPVTITVLFWSAQIDRFLLFPALFLLGLAAGFVLGWGWEQKKKRKAA